MLTFYCPGSVIQIGQQNHLKFQVTFWVDVPDLFDLTPSDTYMHQ